MDTLIQCIIGKQAHREPETGLVAQEPFIVPAGMSAFSEQHLHFLAESLPKSCGPRYRTGRWIS